MIGIMMMFFQRAYLPVFHTLSYFDSFCATNVEWSGINALIYYGPLLMMRIGLDGDVLELLGSGGIGIVQFLAVIPAILYIDRIGTSTPKGRSLRLLTDRFTSYRKEASSAM